MTRQSQFRIDPATFELPAERPWPHGLREQLGAIGWGGIAGRHIIVEGMDGTGKSTLIGQLEVHLRLPRHRKFSPSQGPDLSTLDQRTQEDLELLSADEKPIGIYDRYPIISELIYGPIIRSSLTGWFNDGQWVAIGQEILKRRTVIVWCRPPLAAVHHNLRKNRDMRGVRENLTPLYNAYLSAYEKWIGPKVKYNYMEHDPHELVKFLHPFTQRKQITT